jgi:hypothetical protein
MRLKSLVVAVVMLAMVFPFWRPAQAGDEVHCVNVHEVVLSPGLSIQGSAGSITVPIVKTMECQGLMNGRMPTGVGSYGEEPGRYGTQDPDSCQDGGEGDGVFFASIPTADGDLELRAPYTYTFGDLVSNPGFVSGQFKGDGVRGTFKVRPLEGDCVTSPITRVHVDAEFWFVPSFFAR